MSKLFIGVDLGGTKIYTALSDERGNILKEIIMLTKFLMFIKNMKS